MVPFYPCSLWVPLLKAKIVGKSVTFIKGAAQEPRYKRLRAKLAWLTSEPLLKVRLLNFSILIIVHI